MESHKVLTTAPRAQDQGRPVELSMELKADYRLGVAEEDVLPHELRIMGKVVVCCGSDQFWSHWILTEPLFVICIEGKPRNVWASGFLPRYGPLPFSSMYFALVLGQTTNLVDRPFPVCGFLGHPWQVADIISWVMGIIVVRFIVRSALHAKALNHSQMGL